MSSTPASETFANEKDEKNLASPRINSVSRSQIGEVFDEDEEVVVGWRTWMAAISGASCVFSGYYTGLLLGNTSLAIVTQFKHPELQTWIPNAYAVITAALGGLIGSCSDTVGRKNILLGGLAIACLGNIIIASSQNIGSVIVGASMSSGIFVNQGNFFSVPAEVLPRRYRGIGATITVSAGGFGALLCLMFAGSTITNDTGGLSWRSSYILGAFIHVMAAALLIVFYRPLESPKEAGVSTFAALRKKVDWLGAFLLAAGVGLFMTGLTMGGESFPWASPQVLGTLCAGAGTLVALAVHQVFFNKHGILDRDLWTRNFCVAAFGCFVEGIVFFSILLFFPLETSVLWEDRVYFQNVRLLAFFATSAVVAPFVGWYTRYTKDLKYPLLTGWAFVLIGAIILATAGTNSNKSSIGGLFIIGVGFATPLALLFAIAQLATPPHLLGLTTGQLISARAVGQAVGASVLIAVFKVEVGSLLPADVAAAAVKAGLPLTSVTEFVTGIASGNATMLEAAPGVTPAIIQAGSSAAVGAYVKSFHYGWDTALPFAIVALLLVFLLDGSKIKAQMTWLVERPVAVIEHVHHDEEHAAGGGGSRRASIISALQRRLSDVK